MFALNEEIAINEVVRYVIWVPHKASTVIFISFITATIFVWKQVPPKNYSLIFSTSDYTDYIWLEMKSFLDIFKEFAIISLLISKLKSSRYVGTFQQVFHLKLEPEACQAQWSERRDLAVIGKIGEINKNYSRQLFCKFRTNMTLYHLPFNRNSQIVSLEIWIFSDFCILWTNLATFTTIVLCLCSVPCLFHVSNFPLAYRIDIFDEMLTGIY